MRDLGVGLSSAEAQHVLDRFWRADPSRVRTVGGSGLGLSISLEDARLHGGWLQPVGNDVNVGRPGVAVMHGQRARLLNHSVGPVCGHQHAHPARRLCQRHWQRRLPPVAG